MKILFDHQLFSWQRYGGASKYFAMLLNALPRDMWKTTTVYSNNAYVEALNLFPHRHFLPKLYFRGQGRLMHEIGKLYSKHVIARGHFDVYHQTHFDPFALKVLDNKPMVTTFHDTNFSTINPQPKVVSWQRTSLDRADKIIAISQTTKRDMVELFNIPESKVAVIYHGIDLKDFQICYPPIFDFPYVLYVGSRVIHKNFDNFVKSFSIVAQKFNHIKCVCTYKPFTYEETKMFEQLKIADRMFHIAASEIQMKQLYQHALLFVFPSLYEGFGMPILEAMAANCPVALSEASCFPEIAQDAALYFDPKNPETIAQRICEIIDSSELRSALIERGANRVRDFSWEKCAQQHIEVYKSLL